MAARKKARKKVTKKKTVKRKVAKKKVTKRKATTKKKIKVKALPSKRSKSIKIKRGPSMTVAVIALILNLFIPGLGSLIGGKITSGIWQLVIFMIGIPLSLIVVGVPLVLVAWVWGIVTGVQLLQTAK